MIAKLQTFGFGALLALVTASPSVAHHSWPVSFSREVTVKGTVTAVDWNNPHPMFDLDVRADNGKVEKWKVGGPAINRMEAKGWTRTTLKVGDVITAIGYRFSDGSPILRVEKMIMADGKEMFLYGTK